MGRIYLGLARMARFSPGYNLSGFQPSKTQRTDQDAGRRGIQNMTNLNEDWTGCLRCDVNFRVHPRRAASIVVQPCQ
jgi:hypothetical protein